MVMKQNLNVICPKCSTELPENVKFCTECGQPIEHNSTVGSHNIKPIPKDEDYDVVESLKESGNYLLNDFRDSSKDVVNEVSNLLNKAISNKSEKCPQCSAELPNKDFDFCTECGSPIEHRRLVYSPDQRHIIQEDSNYDEIGKLDYLEKLADLRDKGIISDEDFEKKKKELLKI